MASHSPTSEERTERTGIVLFFAMLAIIVGSIAIFIIFEPM